MLMLNPLHDKLDSYRWDNFHPSCYTSKQSINYYCFRRKEGTIFTFPFLPLSFLFIKIPFIDSYFPLSPSIQGEKIYPPDYSLHYLNFQQNQAQETHPRALKPVETNLANQASPIHKSSSSTQVWPVFHFIPRDEKRMGGLCTST